MIVSFEGDKFKLIITVRVSADFMTTDQFGNSYLVKGNEVILYDSTGVRKLNYSENNSGKLKSVDASNPLKILLFYPEFAQVCFLDSKLSLQAKIDLKREKIQQPELVCTSAEGGFWVYDRQDNQLKRLNEKLEVKYESGNLWQILEYDIHPSFITESDKFVYMNNPATGILVFDNFGNYVKTLSFRNIAFMQVKGNDMFFFNEGKLKIYNLRSLVEHPMNLPELNGEELVSARIEKGKLFLLKKENYSIYAFQF